jgi:hypothetical protein
MAPDQDMTFFTIVRAQALQQRLEAFTARSAVSSLCGHDCGRK